MITLNYTDPSGVPHTSSVWLITQLSTQTPQGEGGVGQTTATLTGWHNAAAQAANDLPIGTQEISLSPGAIDLTQTVGTGYAAVYSGAVALGGFFAGGTVS